VFNVKNVFLLTLMSILFSGLANANENLRDPTRPLGHSGNTHASVEQPLRLQSVLVSESRKIAVINGQQVRERDLIKNSGNTQVLSIDSGGVVVQKGTKRWRLELNSVVRN
jgi:MSHA biogenesis protein MshK